MRKATLNEARVTSTPQKSRASTSRALATRVPRKPPRKPKADEDFYPPFLTLSTGQTSFPKKGVREILKAYSEMPWLRAITHKIGVAVGQTDWRLYRTKPIAKSEQFPSVYTRRMNNYSMRTRRQMLKAAVDIDKVEEIFDHPLLDLLYYGNPSLSGNVVLQVTQIHLDLVGEGYWLTEKNGLGAPTSIWPLPPDWIKDFPTLKHPFYSISSHASGEVEVPVTEVVRFKDPDPSDPYGRGSGMAKSLGDELEIDEATAKHIKAFFYNRARPDIIISGDSIGKDDAKRLEEKWLAKSQGFWKAFKPMFFSRKIDVQTLTHTFENTQLVELRKQQRDMFISVVGAPPEKFGNVSESKRSTVHAADLFWNQDIVEPRSERLRLPIQIQLVSQFGNDLILDFHTPVRQDDDFALLVMKSAAYAFTINDWRSRAGKPALPGAIGDKLLIPNALNLQDSDGDGGGNGSAEPIEETIAKVVKQLLEPMDAKMVEEILAALPPGLTTQDVREVMRDVVSHLPTTPPNITVNVPKSDVTVHTAPITVKPPKITVNGAPVNVTTPDVNVDMCANFKLPGKSKVTLEKDTLGRVTSYTKEPLND
jgi:hypothetical protein